VSVSVLLVEDDLLLGEMVALNLAHMGLTVGRAGTFVEGKEALLSGSFGLAILDVMLPGGDGFELAKLARAKGLSMPILMLTARDDLGAKVQGLDSGADDYLTKPFQTEELLARVRAMVRRVGAKPVSGRLELAPWWVDLSTGVCQCAEGDVVLTEKELALMKLFLGHEDEVLERSDILDAVWGLEAFPTDRTVDNFIVRLRRLFERDPADPKRFVTIRGRGYLFRREPG
jgi:two-component system, OmpR family, alkaline phosphatase synthesis response regulator PhoP